MNVTRAVVVELIDSITISEQYSEDNEKYIDVSIYYKFGLKKQAVAKSETELFDTEGSNNSVSAMSLQYSSFRVLVDWRRERDSLN